MTGMITAVHRDRYEVFGESKTFYARLKKSNYYNGEAEYLFPTVGDMVELQYEDQGDSLIIATMPRKSVFLRQNPTPGMPDQAVAANFDYIFIIMSLNHDYNLTKLERYLANAWQSGGTPVVVLSKVDLCDNAEEQIGQIIQSAIGVDVYAISSMTGQGMEQLKPYLSEDRIVAIMGSSGVGKSTLVNALMGEEVMETNGIRECDSQGHHTTTHRQCFRLPEGAIIIDTPGMRHMRMGDSEEGISQTYEDIEGLMQECKFRSCTHKKEEGCAVKAALRSGRLTEKRWETYLNLKAEERYSQTRAEILTRKQMKNRNKYSKRDRRYELD